MNAVLSNIIKFDQEDDFDKNVYLKIYKDIR